MSEEKDNVTILKNHVVIIGIGSSGIAAAKSLSIRNDVEITILEARNRIGGRVNKVFMYKNLDSMDVSKDNFLSDENEDSKVLIGLGANWIHGLEKSGNPMFEIANQLQLSLQRTSSDDNPGEDVLLFDMVGDDSCSLYKTISPEEYSEALARYEIIVDMVCKNELLVDVNDTTKYSLKEYFNIAVKLTDEKFGRISEACYRCINWFLDRIAIDIGSPLEKTDINSYLEGESDGQYGEALVEGGYLQLLEHVMESLQSKVSLRLNHIADKIVVENERNKVVIHCSNGEIVECDRVLLTVPVGVIKRNKIQFIPFIPRKIEELCSKVDLGLMNTIWLWFPNIFWPEKYNFFGLAHSKVNNNITFTTFLAPLVHDQFGKRQAILMCQVVGEFAKEIENMSDSAIAELATESLRKMFGASVVPSPVGCIHSSWYSDPFAAGSYSFLPHKVGMTETDLTTGSSDLSNNSEDIRSDNCLSLDSFIYYAGEADSVLHRGTVHGAYQSGIKEAQKIYRSFLNN